jgi:hypothetical protein
MPLPPGRRAFGAHGPSERFGLGSRRTERKHGGPATDRNIDTG